MYYVPGTFCSSLYTYYLWSSKQSFKIEDISGWNSSVSCPRWQSQGANTGLFDFDPCFFHSTPMRDMFGPTGACAFPLTKASNTIFHHYVRISLDQSLTGSCEMCHKAQLLWNISLNLTWKKIFSFEVNR